MALNFQTSKSKELQDRMKDWLAKCIHDIHKKYPDASIDHNDFIKAILYTIKSTKTRLLKQSSRMSEDQPPDTPPRRNSSQKNRISPEAQPVNRKSINNLGSYPMNETREVIPNGLTNVYGNCYMNSAVQCLSASTIFTEALDKFRESPQLQELMASLRTRTSSYIDSSNFYNYFTSLNRDFYDVRGKDAAQFISRIISGLTNLKQIFMIEQSYSCKCFRCGSIPEIKSRNIFYILNPPRIASTISNLIDDQISSYEMDSDCECGGRVRLRMKILKLPDVLIIHINRYSRTGHKIDTPVYPELSLDVRMESSMKKYDLVGVCCHLGTLRSGHYFAYAKHGRTWYECNDARVTRINPQEVERNQDAYILFYQAAI